MTPAPLLPSSPPPRRRRAPLAPRPGAALVAALLLGLGASSLGQETPSADDELRARAAALVAAHATPRSERPRTIDALDYDLRLDVDLPARRIEGTLELSFKVWGVPRQKIELDADELVVTRIVDGEGEEREFEHEGTRLSIDLGRVVNPQQPCRLRIDYHATPRRGLVFVASDPARPDVLDQVWSQGQSEMTQAWFPCRDAPDDRASFRLRVSVDEALQTFSNGVLLEQTTHEGRRTDHWRMESPFPVYLSNLVVGRFEEIDLGRVRDVPLLAHASADLARIAAEALRHTGPALSFLEQLSGAPYPYPVYRQVLVSEYPYGGMENVSCSTLNERRLPPRGAPSEPTPRLDALVVHELAHQWWGNSITCASWSDLWLNEGFVTYAEVLYLEQAYDEDTAHLHLLELQDAANQTLVSSGRPVVCEHYASPDDLFDAHVYEAGAVFLHLLRGVLGDEAFFAGLQRWTRERADQCVRTDDLRACFQVGVERDLAPLFDQWLHRPGRPELQCRWRYDLTDRVLIVRIEQTQQGEGVPEVYTFPLSLEFSGQGGQRAARVEIDERVEELRIECPVAPDHVRFNARAWVPAVFEVQQSTEQWRHQLDLGSTSLARAEAAGALGAWFAAEPREGDEAETNLVALCRALIHDPSVLVRRAAVEAVAATARPAARTALATSLHDDDSRVRAASAQALGGFPRDPAAVDGLMKALPLEDRPEVQAAIVTGVAATGFEELGPLMESLLEAPRYRGAPHAAALLGLARLAPKDAEARVLSAASPGQDRELRAAAVEALGLLAPGSDPAARRLVELLSDPAIPLRYAAAGALAELRDPELLAPLVEAHAAAPFDDLRAAIAAVIEGILAAEESDADESP